MKLCLNTIRQLKNLKGKRVFLRAGFDVPRDARGRIRDDSRIVSGLPTIRFLLQQNVKLIIASHSGRPNGKAVSSLRMDAIAKRLQALLKRKVVKVDDCVGKSVKEYAMKMQNGEVLFLENLRFHIKEEENDVNFAKILASLADIYVNDAFSNSHREHASMVGMPKFLPSFAGFLLEKEVEVLTSIFTDPRRPIVAVIGGVKISSKLGAILNLQKKVDFILLGGALANTVLRARGETVGKSLIEEEMVKKLQSLEVLSNKVKIPVDVLAAQEVSGRCGKAVAVAQVSKKSYIVDIGPDTAQLYSQIIKRAKTIIFAGPMGMFEKTQFSHGTKKIISAIGKNRECFSLAGGGDTISAIEHLGDREQFDFISSGGGAMLQFLEGKIFSSIRLLMKTKV